VLPARLVWGGDRGRLLPCSPPCLRRNGDTRGPGSAFVAGR
jgi:hypothetical protein